MMNCESGSEEIPLLSILPQLQRLTNSCFKLQESNFTKTQQTIFTVLSRRESLTMSQIAEFISSSNEQATRAVAPMADAGYVERFIEPDNRKRVHIRLTPTGRSYLEERNRAYYANLRKRLDESLSPEDRQELRLAVNTIIRILDQV